MAEPAYLLDTNICIFFRKGRFPALGDRLEAMASGSVAMSLITYGELVFGVEKSQDPERSRSILDRLTARIPVLGLDPDVGDHYGEIRAYLARSGRPIGANDLWIAAHARRLDLTLVTNNVGEFTRVPRLKVVDWTN